MRLFAVAIAFCLAGFAVSAKPSDVADTARVSDAVITGTGLPRKLSDFKFFKDAGGWQPNEDVVPYELNSPLYSDYAEKYRFIYVPGGKHLSFDSGDTDGRIRFPVGSAIIKSFGYNLDGKDQLLETRVLLHRADGWLALPYLWNEEQTEAVLKVAGKRLPVSFTDPSGEKQTISYAVPNKNQCKECHSLKDAVMPIGPKLRNLDDDSIKELIAAKLLRSDMPPTAPMPDYSKNIAPIGDRARAYLDINCAHCHNRKGSASNSGLYLTYQEPDGPNLGLGKRPTAAGRGSGGRQFAIDPGRPEESYMIYRMKSTDPGIAMPEVGRSIPHKEGVALLSEWIEGLGN